MKVKKKSYITLIIILILIILNVFSIYFIFNLKTILDLGHYQIKETDKINNGEISTNIEYILDARYEDQTGIYEVTLNIFYISNQIDEIIGISSVNYIILKNSDIKLEDDTVFDNPKKNYLNRFWTSLNIDDKLNVSGSISLLVNIDESNITLNSEFSLSLTPDISMWEYYYQLDIGRVGFEILLVVSLFVLIFYFFRNIKDITFQKNLTSSEKKRSESYFGYIREESEKRSEE